METVKILTPDGSVWRPVASTTAMAYARSWGATIQLTNGMRLSPYERGDSWESISKQNGVIVIERLVGAAVLAVLNCQDGAFMRCPDHKTYLTSMYRRQKARMVHVEGKGWVAR